MVEKVATINKEYKRNSYASNSSSVMIKEHFSIHDLT